jgi:hypothetical protein
LLQPRAFAGLDVMARLCGFPENLAWAAARFSPPWRAADEGADIAKPMMNTYLLYLRFRLMRGEVTGGEYAKEVRWRPNVAAAKRRTGRTPGAGRGGGARYDLGQRASGRGPPAGPIVPRRRPG